MKVCSLTKEALGGLSVDNIILLVQEIHFIPSLARGNIDVVCIIKLGRILNNLIASYEPDPTLRLSKRNLLRCTGKERMLHDLCL